MRWPTPPLSTSLSLIDRDIVALALRRLRPELIAALTRAEESAKCHPRLVPGLRAALDSLDSLTFEVEPDGASMIEWLLHAAEGAIGR